MEAIIIIANGCVCSMFVLGAERLRDEALCMLRYIFSSLPDLENLQKVEMPRGILHMQHLYCEVVRSAIQGLGLELEKQTSLILWSMRDSTTNGGIKQPLDQRESMSGPHSAKSIHASSLELIGVVRYSCIIPFKKGTFSTKLLEDLKSLLTT